MSSKMKRLQIYLEPEVDEELGRLAARRGVSKARLLRDGARLVLREQLPFEEDPLLAIVALGHGKSSRLSEEHDKYLIEKKLKRGVQ